MKVIANFTTKGLALLLLIGTTGCNGDTTSNSGNDNALYDVNCWGLHTELATPDPAEGPCGQAGTTADRNSTQHNVMVHIRCPIDIGDNTEPNLNKFRVAMEESGGHRDLLAKLKQIADSQARTSLAVLEDEDAQNFKNSIPRGWRFNCVLDHTGNSGQRLAYIDLTYQKDISVDDVPNFDDIDGLHKDPECPHFVRTKNTLEADIDDPGAKVILGIYSGNVHHGTSTWDQITSQATRPQIASLKAPAATSTNDQAVVLHIRFLLTGSNKAAHLSSLRAALGNAPGQKNVLDLIEELAPSETNSSERSLVTSKLEQLKACDGPAFANGIPSGWQIQCVNDQKKGASEATYAIDITYHKTIPSESGFSLNDIDGALDSNIKTGPVLQMLRNVVDDYAARVILGIDDPPKPVANADSATNTAQSN